VTVPLAELPGVRLGAEGRLLSTYMQKFPANPSAGRDITVIDQPRRRTLGRASMDTRYGRGRPGDPKARRRFVRPDFLPASPLIAAETVMRHA